MAENKMFPTAKPATIITLKHKRSLTPWICVHGYKINNSICIFTQTKETINFNFYNMDIMPYMRSNIKEE